MRPASALATRLVHQCFKKQKILQTLNTKIIQIQHGSVTLQMSKSPLALQHHGFFHGGIITSLADSAAGLAGHSVLTQQHHSTITVQLKINFMRPADGQMIRAVGKILKENKMLMVTTAEVFTGDKLCAYMVQTIKRITNEGRVN